MRIRSILARSRDVGRGQALVETALVIPILLILLLGAIDFGRLFFGWANLHQAVRIGANYAATSTGGEFDRMRFEELIENDLSDINCDVVDPLPNPTYTAADGTPTADPRLGDYAVLTLACAFEPITPLGNLLFGDPIDMSAMSTFPVREGCINCPTPLPATPPPTPLQCRPVPNMVGMSVSGARLAWQSAGFSTANFTPLAGQDTRTVRDQVVTQNDPLSTCAMPTLAIFSSSVTVTLTPVANPCAQAIVPNLVGMTLAEARTEWTDAGFSAASFTADGGDPTVPPQDRVVTAQTTVPASTGGVDCVDPTTTTVDVTTGAAWPAPPPSPCRVPNMINLTRPEGQTAWTAANFTGSYSPANGNFRIRSQSLVGGTYVECGGSIEVSSSAGGGAP